MNETLSFRNHPAIKSVLSSLDEKTKRYMIKIIDETEKALWTVIRWSEWAIININWIDTNREHVLWMLDLAWKYKDIFEKICDFEDLIIAIIVHDLWEYWNWDISQTDPEAEKKKKETKENERKTALELIWKISDENLRKRAENIMNRYIDFSLNCYAEDYDTLILVTKLLDFVQWFDYWVDEVFMANIESDERKKEYVLEHIILWLKKVVWLLRLLESNVMLKTWKENKDTLDFISYWREVKSDWTRIKTRWVYDLWGNEILPYLRKKIKDKYWLDFELNFNIVDEWIRIIAMKFWVPNGITPEQKFFNIYMKLLLKSND